jgi:predicted O-methyltransferase YrrM
MIPSISKAELGCGTTRSIRQYMCPGEMEVFVALVSRAHPRVVVEFGVNEGITANELLLRFIDIDRYVGLDVPAEYVDEIWPQQRGEIPHEPGRLVNDDPRFDLIVRRHGSLDLQPADLPTCDVAYIDGDHHYKVGKHDSHLARRIVRPGGIIIWHDVGNQLTPGVQQLLEELYVIGWPITRVNDTWLAFMQV